MTNPGVAGVVAELLLDPQQLVVLSPNEPQVDLDGGIATAVEDLAAWMASITLMTRASYPKIGKRRCLASRSIPPWIADFTSR